MFCIKYYFFIFCMLSVIILMNFLFAERNILDTFSVIQEINMEISGKSILSLTRVFWQKERNGTIICRKNK